MTHKLIGNLSKGLLFILSAPAGTGKTTLINMLTHEFSSVVASVSYTTRAPRPGEVNHIHYHFIDETQFFKMKSENVFLETAELYGCYYGTSRLMVENMLCQGKHVVLVIDTQGARQLRGIFPGSTIFVAPPTIEELRKRLTSRQTENQESLNKRLRWAEEEMKRSSEYDYCIINDDLAIAFQVLRSIFIAEEHRIRYYH